MQKTKRKKNRNKTNIAPSEVQKSLKNLRKNNKNQKITKTHFDTIFWMLAEHIIIDKHKWSKVVGLEW